MQSRLTDQIIRGAIIALLTITSLCHTATSAIAQTNCFSAPSGLISWWRGEGNAQDMIGGNNGTVPNGIGYVTGEVGQAFSFTSDNQVVDVGVATNLQLQSFTIEAWIQRGSLSYVSLDPQGDGHIFGYGEGGYALALNSNGNLLLTLIGESEIVSSLTITDLNFHHIAVTVSTSSLVTFYVDGVGSVAGTYAPGYFFSTDGGIGATSDTQENCFYGTIDEVSIYNRALSANEIAGIFDAGSAGKCLGPDIIVQPENQWSLIGGNATFDVIAGGLAPLRYQWFFNGSQITYATNTALTITNVQTKNVGTYWVVVTNSYGSVVSSNALLTIGIPPCFAPPSNTVSWWPGESNALDILGGNNGTLVGNVTYTNAEVGRGFQINTNGAGVAVGSPANLQLQDFTIEAWIRRSSPSFVSYDPQGNGTVFGFGDGGFGFCLNSSGNLLLTQMGYSAVTGAGSVTGTSLHHVAVTKSGSTVVFYVDGQLTDNLSYNPGFTFSTPAAIGARGDSFGNSFYGAIDELTIFSRALAAGDIQNIYTAAANGKCSVSPVVITAAPTNTAAVLGGSATFVVSASGSPPLAYQWTFNGTNISSGTNTSYTINNIAGANLGSYRIIVSNPWSFASSTALLDLNPQIAVNGEIATNLAFTNLSSVSVQMNSTFSNATIFYSLDGSVPDFGATLYNGPFTLTNSAPIQAIAYDQNFNSALSQVVQVTFLTSHTLTVLNAGGGTVTLYPPGGTYVNTQIVQVVAAPTNGWSFLQWSGAITSTNTSINIAMTNSQIVQATFGASMTVNTPQNGTVQLNPFQTAYPFGSSLQISAIPSPGYYFGLWGGSASGVTNPFPMTITAANPTVSALFAALSAGHYSLTVIPNGIGTLGISPRANSFASNASVTVTATPSGTNQFYYWTGSVTSSVNPLTLAMNTNKTITANFSGGKYPIQFSPILTTPTNFQFSLTGGPLRVYDVDVSTNLTNWSLLKTVTNLNGAIPVSDTTTNSAKKFYRAVQH